MSDEKNSGQSWPAPRKFVVTVEVVQRYEKVVEASSPASARNLAMSLGIYEDDNNLMNTEVGDHMVQPLKEE